MATQNPSLEGTATGHRPLRKKRMRPADAAFHAFALSAVAIALAALAWLFISILQSGLGALTWDFLTDPVSTSAERAGFNSALRGSLVLMIITLVVAIPIGFAAAIYLEKFAALSREQLDGHTRARRRRLAEMQARGASGPQMLRARAGIRASAVWARIGPPLTRVVEVNTSNLAAVPSIIYGLLGLAMFVTFIGFNKSLLAGGLTLAVLVLPIVIIASREAIRAVPVSNEQGAMALGATRWQAVSRQTVPVPAVSGAGGAMTSGAATWTSSETVVVVAREVESVTCGGLLTSDG